MKYQIRELYKYLARGFIKKYNLRYRIDRSFPVRLVLPGVFANFYEDLTRVNGTDPHLKNLMSNFEMTFGSYTRTKQAHELNACVSNAFIYAEGLAGKTSGENGTLGNLCDCLRCWPHTTIRESLKKLYGFRNDYPGLGHAGNPESKLRDWNRETQSLSACFFYLLRATLRTRFELKIVLRTSSLRVHTESRNVVVKGLVQ